MKQKLLIFIGIIFMMSFISCSQDAEVVSMEPETRAFKECTSSCFNGSAQTHCFRCGQVTCSYHAHYGECESFHPKCEFCDHEDHSTDPCDYIYNGNVALECSCKGVPTICSICGKEQVNGIICGPHFL